MEAPTSEMAISIIKIPFLAFVLTQRQLDRLPGAEVGNLREGMLAHAHYICQTGKYRKDKTGGEFSALAVNMKSRKGRMTFFISPPLCEPAVVMGFSWSVFKIFYTF